MKRIKKRIGRATLFVMLSLMVLTACGRKENFDNCKLTASEEKDISRKEVSVHDPSVVYDNGSYYIFGSHLAGAKSTDLINWKMIGNGVKKGNPIIDDPLHEMQEAFTWAKTGTFWAPDVIQLADGKYYMYYCNCEGSSPLSALGMAVSDDIEGPYKDLGIILKSGMTDIPSENGDFYDATVYPNAVDPCVYYDTDGKLWMMYGSYSGGIYVLELDTRTGKPLESGYGKKLLGGNHLRIEGAYVLYNPDTAYYYMFLSFGGLDSDGGYNIRVCRSENPDGPYYDSMGNDMIDCKGPDGSFFDDVTAERYGTKLMGNYKWAWHEGEDGEKRIGLLSPGHNTALRDENTGNYYIIFHTRFEGKGEAHQIRTHEMYFNEDGWPVIAPYRYGGEADGGTDSETGSDTTGMEEDTTAQVAAGKTEALEKAQVAGIYKYINHGRKISTDMNESTEIILYSNGNVTDSQDKKIGKWNILKENHMEITIDEILYKGLFSREYDEFGKKEVMTFTALSEEKGISIWGSNLEALN